MVRYDDYEQDSEVTRRTGMDSLDAALREAEKYMLNCRDSSDCTSEQSGDQTVDDGCDQLQDIEEDGIASTLHGSNQQPSSARPPQLRNRSRMLKKRNRLQKDLENALPLVLPDQPFSSEELSNDFALTFFNHMRDRLEQPVFSELVSLLSKYGENIHSVTDLYHHAMEILKDQPELCEEFLGFLLPHQALHCGKFMEHLGLIEMTAFLRRLQMNFSRQPQQLRKIFASLARLVDTPHLTIEMVKSTILPLLRGNAFLIDSFLQLLPSEKPPESKMTDFDNLIYEEMEFELSTDDEAFERVEIPPETDDIYGGENCRCCCHDTTLEESNGSGSQRSRHCAPCGLKFMSGKVFMQTEHGLRPVRIHFSGGGSNSANVKRLNSNPQKLARSRSRRGRRITAQMNVKTEESKTLEIDEEVCFPNKTKSPRAQRPKISKQGRVKSAKSLSLSRSNGCRKSNVAKGSLSPLPPPLDQEAHPASEVIEDVKPETLDFKAVSDVLHVDKEKLETMITLHENDIKLSNLNESVENKTCENNSNDNKDFNKTECEDELVCDVDVSGESSEVDLDDSSESGEDNSWTREEDRVILHTFQAESNTERTLTMISSQLPNRSKEEISRRFQTLMNLIQRMR